MLVTVEKPLASGGIRRQVHSLRCIELATDCLKSVVFAYRYFQSSSDIEPGV
jgi:hypothetical protein